jgi:hypothetical protein
MPAKAFSKGKQAEEQAERDRIVTNKANAVANRLWKAEDKAVCDLQASIRKQEVAEKRHQKAADIQARKDQRHAAKQAHEARLAQTKANKAAVIRRRSTVIANVLREG